jgi:protein SCO1/2
VSEAAPPADRLERTNRGLRHTLRWIRIIRLLAFVVVVGTMAAVEITKPRRPPLPRYGVVPDFQLVGADNRPFGAKQLDGHVWVADFIFTTCPEVCPMMTERMNHLQTWLLNQRLGDKVHLVSISVDPDRDTPAVLQKYAETAHARPQLWAFLTGPQQQIEDAVVRGFKLAVVKEKDDSQEDGFAIVHGTKFVLVDGQRQIRGYYDSNDAQSLETLRHDVGALADGAP